MLCQIIKCVIGCDIQPFFQVHKNLSIQLSLCFRQTERVKIMKGKDNINVVYTITKK